MINNTDKKEKSAKVNAKVDHVANTSSESIKKPVRNTDSVNVFANDLNWNIVRELPYTDLLGILHNVPEIHEMLQDSTKHTDMLLYVAQHAKAIGLQIFVDGIFDIMPDGYGFIRFAECEYLSSGFDIYISHQMIRKYQFRIGDVIRGTVRLPKTGEKYFALDEVLLLNGVKPNWHAERIYFEKLTPIFPNRAIKFETKRMQDSLTLRLIDIVAPMGFGQRALIVAPPKVGKTSVLKALAHAIEDNHPEVILMALLIDERPEEVTDMKRSIRGEVISSTFDEHASRHVQIAEMTLERARRLVEQGKDVVILLDSITRLGRAYNTFVPSTGKVLSGGIEASALQRPKKFFGSARNIEEGGSLTIIATAMVDTNSKMDEVIFEEFKGTGNCEVQMLRGLAERSIFPAIAINQSGTRRDDLLVSESRLAKINLLKRSMGQNGPIDATEALLKKLKLTKTNDDFFDRLSSL